MKVMVTGGLGGLGQHVCRYLVEDGHEPIAFDLENKVTKKIAKETNDVSVVFGNIMKPETYEKIIPDIDAIVHMAFILPPNSESHPKSFEINVEGTKNLIKTTEKTNPDIRFIFASSVTVFGPTMWQRDPPVTIERPINPTDNYTRHKVCCEEAIIESNLNNWVILRIAEAMFLNISLSPENLNRMYEIPYEQRVEFVHPLDAAMAFKNAATTNVGKKEIFIIGGGKRCQMKFHQQIEKILNIFGLPVPKAEKFTTKTYYLDWYDTKRSQELFKYQTRTFDDYIIDIKKNVGRVKDFIRFFAPIAKYFI
ncbi:MAG: NAD-dependent epimerase/dehydratase family protein [Candidatus Helarchaeota archaeon]